jgi:hypothetical protein
MAPSAKELFAVAQGGQSLEDQLALLAPVEHVQPRDEEWAEAMASLAWMYRATNDDATAIRCANLVVNTQPRGSVWRAQCEVLRAEIANRNREPIDTDGLVDAVHYCPHLLSLRLHMKEPSHWLMRSAKQNNLLKRNNSRAMR